MSATVLAIANQKGGVGKTTTALSLGGALARMGRRVLLADLDPHGCASVHVGLYPERVEASVLDLFAAGGFDPGLWNRAVVRDAACGMDVIPGHSRVTELEMDLAGRENKGLILRDVLAHGAREYDDVLLDCPPNMGVVLVNALVAANRLIIPVQTDFLALHGLRLIFDTVRTLNRVLPRAVDYRVLATMFDRRAGACRRVLTLLRGKLGQRMFETVIGMDTRFREASAMGRIICEVAPDSRGAREYALLAKEVIAS